MEDPKNPIFLIALSANLLSRATPYKYKNKRYIMWHPHPLTPINEWIAVEEINIKEPSEIICVQLSRLLPKGVKQITMSNIVSVLKDENKLDARAVEIDVPIENYDVLFSNKEDKYNYTYIKLKLYKDCPILAVDVKINPNFYYH